MFYECSYCNFSIPELWTQLELIAKCRHETNSYSAKITKLTEENLISKSLFQMTNLKTTENIKECGYLIKKMNKNKFKL